MGNGITIGDGHGFDISDYWQNLLQGLNKHELGVVKVSGKLIHGKPLETIVSDYQTLDNKLNLTLPLVIGGGPQYDSLPAYENSKKINGIRVTSKELLEQMLPVASKNLENVVSALNNGGIDTVAMPCAVFKVKPHGLEIDPKTQEAVDVGLVGDVVYIDTAPVIAAIYDNKIPVLSHIGLDDDGLKYNINATTAAAQLVKALQAYKLILLGNLPILDQWKNVISEIKSEAYLHQLIINGTISDGMALNAKQAYDLLREMGPGRSVQITTPANLLAELLTDGKGTILRQPFIIQSYSKPEHLGEDVLCKLINDAFASRGKKLADNYFTDDGIDKIYVDAEKTGGSVVKKLSHDIGYMCKIFTHPDYRGNGLATELMERINSDYKNGFMWRTDASNNQSKGFYTHFVDKSGQNGLQKHGKFTGYEKIGKYLVFGVNMNKADWENLKGDIGNLPPTMI